MKKAILSLLVLLSFTGCAQRLQQRPKPADAAKAEIKDDKKKTETPVAGDKKTAATGDSNIPTTIVKTDGAAQEQAKPALVTSPAAQTQALKAECNVDFQPVSEEEGGEFMKTVAGLWIEGGLNEIRNVVPSTDTSNLSRSALRLGQKIDEIAISRVTFKQAEKFTPGQSPLVIATNDVLAQAISYRVSSDINGFRLVEVSTTQTGSSAKLKCSTFAVRLETAPAKIHEILHVIGPIQDQKITAEEFIGAGKQKKFTRAN